MREPQELIAHYFRNWSEWLVSARERGAPEQLINRGQTLREKFVPMLAHGDFSIGNVIPVSEQRLALIDTEHAFSGWPAWYDVANMTLRLGTRGSVELAADYINMVRDRLAPADRESFEERFPPVLAYCSVYSFNELKIDGLAGTALQKHLRFAEFAASALTNSSL